MVLGKLLKRVAKFLISRPPVEQIRKEITEFIAKCEQCGKPNAEKPESLKELCEKVHGTIVALFPTIAPFLILSFLSMQKISKIVKPYGIEEKEIQKMWGNRPENLASQMNHSVMRMVILLREMCASDEKLDLFIKEVCEDEHDRGNEVIELISKSSDPKKQQFVKEWDRFMTRFGRRGPMEIDIARPRYQNCPSLLLRMIRNIDPTGYKDEKACDEEREEAIQFVLSKLSKSHQKKVKKLLPYAQVFLSYREHPKYGVISILSSMRGRILEIGDSLKNAGKLETLIGELVTFNQIETNNFPFFMQRGNPLMFIENLVAPYCHIAEDMKKTITSDCEDNGEDVWFSPSYVERIISNLLSNAMKFTPEGGYVSMELSQVSEDGRDLLRIDVSDTGTGIPEADLTHIFDRFYQSDNASMSTGSGIGLSLVKQYAEMHHGRVGVSSEVGKGTVFSVWIPMDLEVTSGEHPRQNVSVLAEEPESQVREKTDMATVMIVDDNQDFLSYMTSELSVHFNVIPASGGESCLKKLHKVQPDVLICDVMMPGIDGFELTKRVKNDIETSHIPVILLTARTSDDIRLEGYETGADAYLTKPFKMDILEARVRNLIEERQKRISSFSSDSDIKPANVAVNSLDEKLMDRIMESIQKNLDNPEYSVEELSSDVGMHRMNLYRKLQSLVGMTPSEFIRTIRLKRAAQILAERPDISVTELADMVGFNTPKYLTRYFKEMFGCAPSQYVRK